MKYTLASLDFGDSIVIASRGQKLLHRMAQKQASDNQELVKNPNPEGRKEKVTKEYADQFEQENKPALEKAKEERPEVKPETPPENKPPEVKKPEEVKPEEVKPETPVKPEVKPAKEVKPKAEKPVKPIGKSEKEKPKKEENPLDKLDYKSKDAEGEKSIFDFLHKFFDMPEPDDKIKKR